MPCRMCRNAYRQGPFLLCTDFLSMSEEEALKKVESIIEPKVIQLFGESGAPMPVQSHVDGAEVNRIIF